MAALLKAGDDFITKPISDSALLTTVYGPLVFFASQLVPAALAAVLNLAALWAWLRFDARPGWKRAIACPIRLS